MTRLAPLGRRTNNCRLLRELIIMLYWHRCYIATLKLPLFHKLMWHRPEDWSRQNSVIWTKRDIWAFEWQVWVILEMITARPDPEKTDAWDAGSPDQVRSPLSIAEPLPTLSKNPHVSNVKKQLPVAGFQILCNCANITLEGANFLTNLHHKPCFCVEIKSGRLKTIRISATSKKS